MNEDDFVDELTEDDLSFLAQWENAGQSEEHENFGLNQSELPEGHGAEIESMADGETDEVDADSDSDERESGESDNTDESKMDISQMPEGDEDMSDPGSGEDSEDEESDEGHDHLEGGEAPDEIPEGEDDLEYDGLGDESDADDDELGSEDDLEDGDTEQQETEFGDGERADTDEEIDDLDEYERERDEHNSDNDSDEESEDESHEQEINAEGEEDFEGDAQQELEDHLRDNQENPEPEADEPDDATDDGNSGDAEPEDESDGDESGDADGESQGDNDSEPEPLTEEPDAEQQDSEEMDSGLFEKLPEAGDLCTNHCEDNPPEESLEETCPHCTERIRQERELHGAIGTDMHDNPILPGDKLHIRISIAMVAKDSIVTVNVPNSEVDPVRLAINIRGQIDNERCWLSGKGVSNFSGWKMTGVGNAIWTFKKGQQIAFAEKIAQPLFDDMTDDEMLDKLKDDLDNFGKENQQNDERPEDDDELESDSEGSGDSEESEPEPDEEEITDDEPEGSEHERKHKKTLSAAQKARFDNLTERNWKKILGTFGSTVEAERLLDTEDGHIFVTRGGSIVSRGMIYTFGFAARKLEGGEIEEIQEWHADRENEEQE